MTLQQQIRANRWRTAVVIVLFALLTAGVLLILAAAAGVSWMILAGVIAIGYGIISYFASGRMIAALTGAHPVTRQEQPELYQAVEAAAVAAGLARTPPVYLIRDPAPNAFAAGRNLDHAYVAATTGLLEVMGPRELRAVMAHEIAHVRNRDVLLMSLVTVLVGVLMILSDVMLRVFVYGGGRRDTHPLVLVVAIVALLIAPVAAIMLQMTVSRRREFLADAGAAEITGDAEGMARALALLDADPRHLRSVGKGTAHLYIESPLDKEQGATKFLSGLFATHPPIDDRIRALESAGGFQLDRDTLRVGDSIASPPQ